MEYLRNNYTKNVNMNIQPQGINNPRQFDIPLKSINHTHIMHAQSYNIQTHINMKYTHVISMKHMLYTHNHTTYTPCN